jgi:hypothetical protein
VTPELDDDLARMRRPDEAGDLDRPSDRPEPDEASILVKVASASPADGKFFLGQPQAVSGAETEGGAVTITPVSPASTIAVAPRGAPPGTYAIADFVNFRWVTRRAAAAPGGGGSPCASPPSFCIGVSLGSCWSMSDAVTVTFSQSGSTLGTCTLHPAVTVDGPPAYTVRSVPDSCCITSNVTPGSVVDWTAVGSLIGTRSGSFAATTCGTNSAAIAWVWVDTLPDTLHVTDPDGNAVPITRGGPAGPSIGGRTWSGSWTYTRTDSLGIVQTFTVSYVWSGCVLKIDSTTVTDVPEQNYCNYNWDGVNPPSATFLGLPAWPSPPAPSVSLDPLSIYYTPWFDILSKSGVGTLIQKVRPFSGACGSDLFSKIQFVGEGVWTKFTPGVPWILTL